MRRYEVCQFGTLPMKHHDVDTKLGMYAEWLDKTCDREKPDGIAWEGPLLMPSDTVVLVKLLCGLIGITSACRYRRKLPYREVPVGDVKRAVTGHGRADKDMMVAAAMNVMDWNVEDHHQADAGGVGLCAYDELFPKT